MEEKVLRMLEQINSNVEKLSADIGEIKQDISVLDKNISILDKKIESVENKISLMDVRVKKMEFTQENTISYHVSLIAENHSALNDKLNILLEKDSKNYLLKMKVNVLEDEINKLKHPEH